VGVGRNIPAGLAMWLGGQDLVYNMNQMSDSLQKCFRFSIHVTRTSNEVTEFFSQCSAQRLAIRLKQWNIVAQLRHLLRASHDLVESSL
jgi:hypothetical protein